MVPKWSDRSDERALTAGETAMARLIFQNAIAYEKVKIHRGSYFPEKESPGSPKDPPALAKEPPAPEVSSSAAPPA